jgi:hypothetical protein
MEAKELNEGKKIPYRGFYINWLLEKEESTLKKKKKNVRSVCERMFV